MQLYTKFDLSWIFTCFTYLYDLKYNQNESLQKNGAQICVTCYLVHMVGPSSPAALCVTISDSTIFLVRVLGIPRCGTPTTILNSEHGVPQLQGALEAFLDSVNSLLVITIQQSTLSLDGRDCPLIRVLETSHRWVGFGRWEAVWEGSFRGRCRCWSGWSDLWNNIVILIL